MFYIQQIRFSWTIKLTDISKIQNVSLLGPRGGVKARSIEVGGSLALDNITSDDYYA